MEKEDGFLNGIHCSFVNNWENPMDQCDGDPFESALSSMVSSPTAASANANENMVLRELIGRLGTICNGNGNGNGEVSPHHLPLNANANAINININNSNSANASCYSTPLNSPPNLNLSSFFIDHHHHHQIRGGPPTHFPSLPGLTPFSSDPGFAERAARLSCFANNTLTLEPPQQQPHLDSGSHPSSIGISGSKSTNVYPTTMLAVQESRDNKLMISRLSRSSTPENVELGDSRENSSVSEQIPSSTTAATTDANSRKRKSNPKGKGKAKGNPTPSPTDANGVASESSESGAKRSKSDEGERSKTCDDDDINPKQSSSKPPEPPKDYIHVRARRGQATDAHSLAERVLKISDRMKVLQDLVPGCNKVTGIDVMLDEIINYVQSLQRQVEFLSMKLAAVNPRMDSNTEAATLSKDVLQLSPPLHPHNSNNSIYPLDHSYYHFDTRSNLHSGILPGGSGTQAPFLPPTAAALATARSNQSHKLPPPPVDNITHTTPASRVITPSSYQVMPNTCHDLNCSIEVGEVEENNGIWVDLNEEVTVPYGKYGRQRNRMSINITLEDLKPHFGKKLKDVVKEVGVSRSTIKRVCRESNIHRWPSHRNNKNNCAGFGTRMVNNRVQNSKKQMLNVCSSSESTSPNLPLNQNNLDDNASEVNKNFTETAEADVMVIKATFDNDTAKIQLYMSSSLEKLKEEVIKRFELEEGSFKLKYVDEDDQWILLACDDDLHLCMKTFKASGKTPVQVLVQPVGN